MIAFTAANSRFAHARLFALALWFSVAGCAAALPRVEVADEAATRTPTMATGDGAVSPATAQRVVNDLKDASGPLAILRRHLAIEEAISGQPLILGNRVDLHFDGPATYAAMFKAIRAARDHINLEVYIFEDGDQGRRLVNLLAAKQRAGVQVNIIYDSIGSIDTPRDFFAGLERLGARVLEFNPVNPTKLRRKWRLNRRDHRKILVVDGAVAFTGGVNISDVYSKSSGSGSRSGSSAGGDKKQTGRPWRDTHVEIRGPAVAVFQKLFLDTWQRQRGPELPASNYFPKLAPIGDDVVRVIASTPENPAHEIYKTFLSAVQNAERSIHLTNAYFVPGRDLIEALKQAAARGVDVKIVLPSYSDSGLVFHAGRSHYTGLLRAGVKIYERRNAMLHAKTGVIDGVWSTVGSTNLDLRSFLHNDEVNANFIGTDFAARMEAMFKRDLAESQAIDLETWRKRPIAQRLREFGARLFSYWL